jgi:predicted RNase H-like HicB family nuclease
LTGREPARAGLLGGLPLRTNRAPPTVEREYASCMKTFTAVVERDADTGLFVGWVPGFPGAHTQAETLDELRANLREVVAMLLEDGVPEFVSEFIGTQTVEVV